MLYNREHRAEAATRHPAFPRVGKWSLQSLNATAPTPDPASGFGILWPDQAIEVTQAGRTASLRAGDLTIIDRSHPVEIRRDGPWSASLLDLGDRRVGSRVDDRLRFVCVALDGSTDLAQAVKRLWLLLVDIGRLDLGRRDTGDELIEAQLAEVMTELATRLAAQVIDPRITSHDAAMIDRAQLLIAANLADPRFGVAELAVQMRVSPRHLSSLFARLGTTTSQAILDARIVQARRMLTDPVNARRQIASIALACGFDDQSYFARCFRKATGVTPRAYRGGRGQ
jgi:AraC-like DNA-binding protein